MRSFIYVRCHQGPYFHFSGAAHENRTILGHFRGFLGGIGPNDRVSVDEFLDLRIGSVVDNLIRPHQFGTFDSEAVAIADQAVLGGDAISAGLTVVTGTPSSILKISANSFIKMFLGLIDNLRCQNRTKIT
jgi:hypothetical protein